MRPLIMRPLIHGKNKIHLFSSFLPQAHPCVVGLPSFTLCSSNYCGHSWISAVFSQLRSMANMHQRCQQVSPSGLSRRTWVLGFMQTHFLECILIFLLAPFSLIVKQFDRCSEIGIRLANLSTSGSMAHLIVFKVESTNIMTTLHWPE